MRKPHNKSRLGCLTCKRRKIKCDEVKPECGNCTRFGVSCDFSPIALQSTQTSTATSISARRGRPRSDWASWAEQVRLASSGAVSASCGLNVEDLELFHNYMTTTGLTLGEQNALWCEGVPRLGFKHPCILALVLALSAYQLARIKPLEATKYLGLAEHHSTNALQTATAFLQHLNAENSPVLYIIAVLICFTAFAKGPSPGHLLVVAEHGQVSWLSLLRGVRLVVASTGWSSIFSGPLAEYFPSAGKEEGSSPPVPPMSSVEDWRTSLNETSDVIAVFTEKQFQKTCEHELEVLSNCFESTFGKGQHAQSGIHGKFEVVISWIYQLDDTFVEGLNRKDPVALIILGHFCVLLRTLERYWFMEGWACHIMAEILRASQSSRKWLAWPIQYLEGYGSSITPL